MRLSVVVSVLGASVGCGSVSSNKMPDASVVDIDTAPDAPPAACGDGNRDPGEVCFGQPIVIVGNDVVFDAQLTDEDGDGDLDLLFLIGDQYMFFPQQGGQFAASSLDGPTTISAYYARTLDLGGSSRLELVDAGDNGFSTWRRNTANTAYELINTVPEPTGTTIRAFGMGRVTGSALPNPVAVYTNDLVVGTYNGSLQLSAASLRTVNGIAKHLDVGLIDSDTFEDIVIAMSGGVVLYRGANADLQQVTLTGQTAATDAVAIGDVDDDNTNDIIYSVAGAAGQIGVLKGVGGAAFLAPVTKSVANLGAALESVDIDGDGRIDAVASRALTGSNAVLVMLGKADGTLADPVALPVAAAIDSLRCDADFNGDGAPDCVTTDTASLNMIILPSNP